MSATVTPSTWIASWAVATGTASFPVASVPMLTSAEADGTTGDIRKIWLALCDHMQNSQDALAVTSRPTKMALTKTQTVDAAAGTITTVYTSTFVTKVAADGTFDVAAE